MFRHLAIATSICLLAVLPARAVVEPQREAVDPRLVEIRHASPRSIRVTPDTAGKSGAAALELLEQLGQEWTLRLDPRTGRFTMIQGAGVPLIPGRGNRLDDKAAALDSDGRVSIKKVEPLVRAFLEPHLARVGPPVGELVVDTEASLVREDGRLISVYYDWVVGGVPVEGATVFARVNSGNVTQFGGRWVGSIDVDTVPRIKPGRAVQIVLEHAGHTGLALPEGDPALLIQVEEGQDALTYRLVWTFRYTVPGEIETWEGRVDAHTGAVVGFRDTNHYNRARAGIYLVSPFGSSEQVAPLRDLDVFNGSTKITDDAGEYNYIGGPASSTLSGRWFDMNCVQCSSPTQPTVQTLVGTGVIDLGVGGLDNAGNGTSTPADRSTFFHLNEIRRLALKWVPGVAWLFTPNFQVNTNVALTCNATFNGSSMNFYRSGGGCNNSGLVADVVKHEWGHGIDSNTQSGDSGTGEGTADVNAMQMSHSNLMGPGFGTGGSAVRNLAWQSSSVGLMTQSRIDSGDCNTQQGVSPHCVGQVYGQAAWELAQALTAKHGHHTGWRQSERLFYTSLVDAGSWDPDDPLNIYEAYLNADDDDGNLANGTPNGAEIFAAFNLHEIATVPAVSTPQCARPEQPLLTIDTDCDSVDIDWSPVSGAASYHIFRADLRANTAYLPLGQVNGATTTFTDTEVVPEVDYHYVVMSVDAQGCESTVESPRLVRLADQPYLDLLAYQLDDVTGGNGSGFADPGEKVELELNLINRGTAPANSITATLVALTPGLTLLDAATTYPNITAENVAQNADNLRFETSFDLACGTLIGFRLDVAEASTCSTRSSYFQFALGERVDNQWVCNDAESCFVEPTFSGIESAVPGALCAQALLSWSSGSSNCASGSISYNVYRSTDPAFVPGPENLVATGLTDTQYADLAAVPGQTNWYAVRAVDSASGEEPNGVVLPVEVPAAPDPTPPAFGGILTATSGGSCGETVIAWDPAVEGCNAPVFYDVYRSTDPAFVPGPENLVASVFDTQFVDPGLSPGVAVTYLVRARDGVGNVDANTTRQTVDALAAELPLLAESFDAGPAGWALGAGSNATGGNWQHGDPVATPYQPGNDHSPGGVNCFMTGLLSTPSNGDVDGGTTILVSGVYDMAGAIDPVVRYWRWFTNDRGSAPGESTDRLRLEISNDNGVTWRAVQSVGAGTPLEWVQTEVDFGRFVAPTAQMRFRFTTADLGADSIVEAGIDDFQLLDAAGGCSSCELPVDAVQTIYLDKAGNDVAIDWSGDPAVAARFVVYDWSNPAQPLRVGSTDGQVFLHTGALLSDQLFFYRVTAVDVCGNESD